MNRETDPEAALRDARERIDAIDRQLRSLLNERAACAQELARIKTKTGADSTPVYYRPEREAQVLERLRAENEGP